MKLRTLFISTLTRHAVFYREGDNEYPSITYTTKDGVEFDDKEAVLATAAGISVTPKQSAKTGRWMVFERLALLRFQNLPNGPKPDLARRRTAVPKLPKGYVAMTEPALIRSLLA